MKYFDMFPNAGEMFSKTLGGNTGELEELKECLTANDNMKFSLN